ncbi:hypothetical protein GCM10009629_41910 [Pseudonocardia alni]
MADGPCTESPWQHRRSTPTSCASAPPVSTGSPTDPASGRAAGRAPRSAAELDPPGEAGHGERHDRPTTTESEELRQLGKENTELRRAADTDVLTGLTNRCRLDRDPTTA